MRVPAPTSPPAARDADDGAVAAFPRRFVDHLTLATTHATIIYWIGVGLVALSVFVPRLLPCVDYPQHLALASIARRLSDPASIEQQSYSINYFTYNGLFHVIVARLGRWIPLEVAGKIVVSGSLALLGGSTLALVKVLRRPPSHAALFTPLLFSFAIAWGFVNYALGTALAVASLVFVARSLVRATVVTLFFAAAFGFLCAMTHVLAMLLLCVFAAAMAPEVAWRSTRPAAQRAPTNDSQAPPGPTWRRSLRAVGRATIALAPLLVGALWCILVYRDQYKLDPAMYKDATMEGSSPPIWQKVVFFGAWATGVHSDFTDQALVALSVGTCVTAIVLAVRRHRRLAREGFAIATHGPTPVVVPLVAMVFAYLATPMVLVGTHLIFPRLAQTVVLAAVLAAPAFRGRWRRPMTTLSLAVGALAGVNLFVHSVVFARETDDASRVVDEAPADRNASAVIYDGGSFAFRTGSLVHLAAYYRARHGGEWSYSFARFLSVPVRFKPPYGRLWPKIGWEFSPGDYNPRCKYARHFDLLFVKAPADVATERGVRHLVFGADADAPRVVSRHGVYWAFDTRGIPEDGTF